MSVYLSSEGLAGPIAHHVGMWGEQNPRGRIPACSGWLQSGRSWKPLGTAGQTDARRSPPGRGQNSSQLQRRAEGHIVDMDCARTTQTYLSWCHGQNTRSFPWDSLQVTWAANSALIQIMSQHNGGEFLQMELFFCELISPAALFRALFHLFLFSEAPLFGCFCCLTFRFWGMCVRKCVSLYKCHLLWAKKASSLWMIIAEGKRRTERVNVWVKMNYFNGNSSWAAIAKLYWTALASVQNGCVCLYVKMTPQGLKEAFICDLISFASTWVLF